MNFTVHLCKQRLDTFLPQERGRYLKNIIEEKPNAARITAPQRIFAKTNPITQPGVYEGDFSFNGGLGGGGGGGGASCSHLQE